jgi:hypothetical protein
LFILCPEIRIFVPGFKASDLGIGDDQNLVPESHGKPLDDPLFHLKAPNQAVYADGKRATLAEYLYQLGNGPVELPPINRLEEIIQGVLPEGLKRVLVIGRREYDIGRFLQALKKIKPG